MWSVGHILITADSIYCPIKSATRIWHRQLNFGHLLSSYRNTLWHSLLWDSTSLTTTTTRRGRVTLIAEGNLVLNCMILLPRLILPLLLLLFLVVQYSPPSLSQVRITLFTFQSRISFRRWGRLFIVDEMIISNFHLVFQHFNISNAELTRWICRMRRMTVMLHERMMTTLAKQTPDGMSQGIAAGHSQRPFKNAKPPDSVLWLMRLSVALKGAAAGLAP